MLPRAHVKDVVQFFERNVVEVAFFGAQRRTRSFQDYEED